MIFFLNLIMIFKKELSPSEPLLYSTQLPILRVSVILTFSYQLQEGSEIDFSSYLHTNRPIHRELHQMEVKKALDAISKRIWSHNLYSMCPGACLGPRLTQVAENISIGLLCITSLQIFRSFFVSFQQNHQQICNVI